MQCLQFDKIPTPLFSILFNLLQRSVIIEHLFSAFYTYEKRGYTFYLFPLISIKNYSNAAG